MKSSKIATALALIATISTALTLQARPCYDEDGNRITCGVVEGSARVVEGAGEGALNILTLGGHERRKEERAQRRDEDIRSERNERVRDQKRDDRRDSRRYN